MVDHQLLILLQKRDPQAISELHSQYGSYCRKIAGNILDRAEDVEEIVNDAFLQVWNAIPNACPENLSAYIATVTRNLAFNRYRRDNAPRRGGTNVPLVLEELSDVVSSTPTPEEIFDAKELAAAINDFLTSLPHWKRYAFIRRYWYADSVQSIARQVHRTQGHISVTLSRLRRKLRDHLTERGFDL
jgi:RNA polymerase sigma-70 factor (ECF subfamily)